jgi:hypothetical protein
MDGIPTVGMGPLGRRAWGTRHPSRARAHENGHGLSLLQCGHLRLVHEAML